MVAIAINGQTAGSCTNTDSSGKYTCTGLPVSATYAIKAVASGGALLKAVQTIGTTAVSQDVTEYTTAGVAVLQQKLVTSFEVGTAFTSTIPFVNIASTLTSITQVATSGSSFTNVVTAVGNAVSANGDPTSSGATSVVSAAKLVANQITTTLSILDPMYSSQWHLKNTGQTGTNGTAGTAGEDINVAPVWGAYMGNCIKIAVVDDGMEIAHEDLSPNVISGGSYNYCTGSTDPTKCASKGAGCGGGDSCHGTSVAGLASAVSNSVGGLGVAPQASIVGYNITQSDSAANEADAETRGNADIYTNSWGAPDGTGKFFGPNSSWASAVDTGNSTGRGGKGSIYTWANGNGGKNRTQGIVCGADRGDYDGQANYHGIFSITALDDIGKQTVYSEEGSNILTSAPGGEWCNSGGSYTGHLSHALTTTDMTGSTGWNNGGYNTEFSTSDLANGNYTMCVNGTSGATPIAAGAIALILQANSALTWRDVRIILAQSARKNDPTDTDWTTNGGSLHINHKYGYGVLNVASGTSLAATWTNVGAQKTATGTASGSVAVPVAAIPNGAGSATSTITIASSGISGTGVEFVDGTVTTDHPYVGDLTITLTSPQGTASTLAVQHPCYPTGCSSSSTAVSCGCINGSTSCASGASWTFGVARLINEKADGVWTLTVQDSVNNAYSGNLISWSIKIYGH